MKTVQILTRRERIAYFTVYPLIKNIARLRERGYSLKISYDPPEKVAPQIYETDILCVSSKVFKDWWGQPERIFSFFKNQRKSAGKIIFLDDADSTGVTSFELLPYIDLYLKKQLLKDRNLYTRSFYGDRIFSDFYHRHFKVTDPKNYQSQPLEEKYFSRVQLSWHIGLGDMKGDIWNPWLRDLKFFLPPRYPQKFTPIRRGRPIDIIFKGSRIYQRPSISFHREKIGEKLDVLHHLNRSLMGRVSIREYIRLFQNSKISLSPFGWGEIGVRDFETWLYGAALIKPDLSHMETWPDVFIPGETYYPLRWDLENLENGISDLLENSFLREKLAENGQDAYRKMTSREGMEKFCSYFIQRLEL